MSSSAPWLTRHHLLGPNLNEGLVAPDVAWVWGDPRKLRSRSHTTLGGAFWIGPTKAVDAFAQSLAADSAARALRSQARPSLLATPMAVAMWCPTGHSCALVGAFSKLGATSDEVTSAVGDTAALSRQHGPLLKLTDALSPGSVWMFITALGRSFDKQVSSGQSHWPIAQNGPALRLAFAITQPAYREGLHDQMRQHSPQLLAVHSANALEDAWTSQSPGHPPLSRL